MRRVSTIREARKAVDLSQGALAELVGMGRWKIQLFKAGFKDPTSAEHKKIMAALKKALKPFQRSI